MRHFGDGSPQPRGHRLHPNAARIQRAAQLYSPQEEPNSISGWAAAIKQILADGPATTLHLARLVSQAKLRLEHGQWSQLWRTGRLPFSKRKGETLGRIGSELGKLNAQNSAHLPAAWSTLYYLALLGKAMAEQLVRNGQIHSGLTLKEAKALLAQYRPGKAPKNSRPDVLNRVHRFARFVQPTLPAWS